MKVISDELDTKSDEVKLKGQFIEVRTLNKSKVKELVEEWYRNKAKENSIKLQILYLKSLF